METFWLSGEFVRIPSAWDYVVVDFILYRRVRDRFGISDWEFVRETA